MRSAVGRDRNCVISIRGYDECDGGERWCQVEGPGRVMRGSSHCIFLNQPVAGNGAGRRFFDLANIVLPARRAFGFGPNIQRWAKQVPVARPDAPALPIVHGPLGFGVVNVSEVADADVLR